MQRPWWWSECIGHNTSGNCFEPPAIPASAPLNTPCSVPDLDLDPQPTAFSPVAAVAIPRLVALGHAALTTVSPCACLRSFFAAPAACSRAAHARPAAATAHPTPTTVHGACAELRYYQAATIVLVGHVPCDSLAPITRCLRIRSHAAAAVTGRRDCLSSCCDDTS